MKLNDIIAAVIALTIALSAGTAIQWAFQVIADELEGVRETIEEVK